jgi:hypothetical protein
MGENMFKTIASGAICILALSAAVDPARGQVGVAVYVYNNTAAKVKGVFQSTDAGDVGTNCTATSGTGSSNCNNSANYKNPPKNIKNLLCISSKVGPQYAQDCQALMFASNCKKNNIWTSLCGAGYGTNIVPQCIYRTGAGQFSSWTWTVSPIPNSANQVTIGCSISNYAVLSN